MGFVWPLVHIHTHPHTVYIHTTSRFTCRHTQTLAQNASHGGGTAITEFRGGFPSPRRTWSVILLEAHKVPHE